MPPRRGAGTLRDALAARLLFLVLVGGSGCGVPYTAQPAPVPRLEVMPWSHTEGSMAIGADPYLRAQRLKLVFGQDLTRYEIIPVQILVRNVGEGRLWLQRSGMALELPNGTAITPLRATTVAKMALPPAPYTPDEMALVALTNMPLLVILNEATGGASETLSRIAGKADLLPNPDGRTDYWRKELKEVILNSGESAHGFLFFPWPRTAPMFEEATLTMPVVELEGATRVVVRVTLRGLRIRRPPVSAEDGSQ